MNEICGQKIPFACALLVACFSNKKQEKGVHKKENIAKLPPIIAEIGPRFDLSSKRRII